MGTLSPSRAATLVGLTAAVLGAVLSIPSLAGGRGPAAIALDRPDVQTVLTASLLLEVGAEPTVRVGVEVERDRVTIYSPGGLHLADALTGQPAGDLGPGETVRVSSGAGLLAATAGGVPVSEGLPSVVLRSSDPAAPVFVEGKAYRGAIEVRAAQDGRVSAINVLPLEEYLLGVVPLEIGPRTEEEMAAVEAQAVAARTYAVSRFGSHADMGFDLYGGVEDQVYGGLGVEREESTRAVRATTGKILLYEGEPIRAFYHSTCGGRTAAVEEVMDRPPAPYLKSVSDRAPDGTDYCSASPRYRWTVRWTPSELDSVARAELAAHFRVSAASLGTIERISIVSRTPSGRVRELAFLGAGSELVLSRLDIRRVLPDEARILNSTDFAVAEREDGLVEIHGRGYGHGAGMCQWGAIGRARAGQTYETILETYYPGAVLVHAYDGAGG